MPYNIRYFDEKRAQYSNEFIALLLELRAIRVGSAFINLNKQTIGFVSVSGILIYFRVKRTMLVTWT